MPPDRPRRSQSRSWLGTPYHDQASFRGVGCDCLGLVRGVWRALYGPEQMPIPPNTRDWGETGSLAAGRGGAEGDARAAADRPRAGALLLFRMRQGALAKHGGIVAAPARFIHADERTGVVEVPLDAD